MRIVFMYQWQINMKKLISIVLVVTMLLPISLHTFSMENTNKGNDVDEDILVVTQESFGATFTSQKTRSVATEIEKINYSYELTESEDNEGVADVTLNIVMVIGNNEYPITVSGSVEAYELSSGCILWEGPIRGNTTINGVEYNVIAGFSKMDDASDIQVSLTLQGADEESSLEPIVLCFGEELITSEVYAEIAENMEEVETQNEEERASTMSSRATTSSVSYVAYDYSTFNSGYNISGYAQRTNAYFDSGRNCFIVAIKSYTNNINKYFSSTGAAYTTVHSFTTRLKFNDTGTSSYSWIGGVDTSGLPDDYNTGETILLRPLFEDAMSCLNIPTSTIAAVLDGLKGSVVKDVEKANAYVTVKFGLLKGAIFDSCGAGIPVVFQLCRKTTGYSGNSSYTFVTSMTYRTTFIPTGTSIHQLLYFDAYDATATAKITLE